MIASLPMYDTPETAAANDRFWQAIRKAYRHGPQALDRKQDPHETWNAPDLVLSQTCGLPYRSGLYRSVQLVGTPDYGVTGCPPGHYCSSIIVRANDPRKAFSDFHGARLARNDQRSQSGWAAILEHTQTCDPQFKFDGQITETGSHAASTRSVIEGTADIAAIDAVTWGLLQRDEPIATSLRVLDRTRPTPGLPLIAGPLENAQALFDAITLAIASLTDEDRHCLQLKGIVKIPKCEYLAVPLP